MSACVCLVYPFPTVPRTASCPKECTGMEKLPRWTNGRSSNRPKQPSHYTKYWTKNGQMRHDSITKVMQEWLIEKFNLAGRRTGERTSQRRKKTEKKTGGGKKNQEVGKSTSKTKPWHLRNLQRGGEKLILVKS